MKRYVHQPTEVEAVQVVAPFRAFTHAFPRHHAVKLPSGRIGYFHLVDAGSLRSRAYPGDWVLKHSSEDGVWWAEILTDIEFTRSYEEKVDE